MDIDRLLDKADVGTITKEELELVVNTLQNPKTTENRYLLLEIIGRSAATEHRPLVESYLHSPEDPWLARQALRILCLLWNLTHDYIEQIVQFVNGVERDTENVCQLIAISIAGAYLRYYSAGKLRIELFEKLLDLYKDANIEHLVREAAYSALARAIGRDWTEIPGAARSFDLVKDIDPTVLETVHNIIDSA